MENEVSVLLSFVQIRIFDDNDLRLGYYYDDNNISNCNNHKCFLFQVEFPYAINKTVTFSIEGFVEIIEFL